MWQNGTEPRQEDGTNLIPRRGSAVVYVESENHSPQDAEDQLQVTCHNVCGAWWREGRRGGRERRGRRGEEEGGVGKGGEEEGGEGVLRC